MSAAVVEVINQAEQMLDHADIILLPSWLITTDLIETLPGHPRLIIKETP